MISSDLERAPKPRRMRDPRVIIRREQGKQKPVWSSTSRIRAASGRAAAPSASSTSAEPHFDVKERLPCLTIGSPQAAATMPAAVETLIDPEKSPPVPQLSANRPPVTEKRALPRAAPRRPRSALPRFRP